ncbi:MAG: AMP-binding protein, partial [Mycobacteriales bacterium]
MTGSHHLAVLEEECFARLGDTPTLLFEGTWTTSGELHERTTRVAGGLRALGVEAGDRVLVLMMNTPEVFVTYQAAWRAGAAVTPVLFLISPPELRHIVTHSEAKVAVVTHELLPLLRSATEGLDLTVVVVGDAPEGTVPYAQLDAAEPLPITPREDDDLAALLYTGGTTGRSKGVMLSHRGLWSGGHALAESAKTSDTTRSLLPLPLSHAFGLLVAIAGMHAEKPRISVLQRWFDAAGWVQLVEEHRLET